jgi:hypothetical protein
LGSSLTEQINFNYQLPQNVSVSSTFRLQPDASPLEQISPLNLGNMPRQGAMSILFEFVVKDIPIDLNQLALAKGFLNFEIPRHTRKTRFVNRVTFDRLVTSDPIKSMPPTGILNAITLLSLYHMQERATEQMSKGDSTSAARYMENMATSLLLKGEHVLAQSVLNEVTNIRNNQSFSEAGEKRIKYGTRSLLLPAGRKQN